MRTNQVTMYRETLNVYSEIPTGTRLQSCAVLTKGRVLNAKACGKIKTCQRVLKC